MKFLAILLLAVVATQAAPQPEPKDLQLVVVDVIKILKIVGDKVLSGISEARPTILDLEAQLNADLAALVDQILLDVEGVVNATVDRIRVLESEVTGAITSINTECASCVKAADAGLDALLEPAEKDIAAALNALNKANEANITSIVESVKSIIADLDAATDAAIAAGVACVKSGSTTVKQCLDDNSATWNAAVVAAGTNLVLVLNQALVFIPLFVTDIVNAVQPIVTDFLDKADAVWVDFGSCVQAGCK